MSYELVRGNGMGKVACCMYQGQRADYLADEGDHNA
jgi:hypothetical protein